MKLAILSREPKLYSTTRLVEAAAQRGYEAVVVDHLQCNLVLEKGAPSIIYQGQPLTGFDAIIPRIGASVTFYGTAVVRQFEMMKVRTAIESQAIVRSRDKLRSMQILSRAGVGMPKTAFTNSSEEVPEMIRQVGGAPVIIKLLEGTQGLGVVLAETEKAAQSVIEAFHNLKARIIVQEFIAESKGADLRAFVVNGEVVGAMKRQGKEGEFRSNLHRGGTGKLVKLTRAEKAAALLATKALGLGIAGVDMLQSARGPLVLEVNSSPGLEGIEKATGLDIAGKIIEYTAEIARKRKPKATKSGKSAPKAMPDTQAD
ncbi:30S ribosomal protein S6--L-glutamate ligase [Hymenobacter lutimineralis]|uniref:Probable alpha-L-glutamate ligase n=1 Tax=Hymenobacter lutimineralis TaxID=2606448 RepID=A0A5D6UWS4_9BACT|nr:MULTISPECIES: 30S ribosomal protein S6--L-glutamate ligase [Hymenobacter]QIX62349.1 30S ribosomal protein S6--L-glutamate ligase [Hymenobacter sp. BT18]TYZ06869.1 30S ribosomal protein S6--L-glutamate ligase [Hymenobacter lutimineralis]